MKTYFRYNPPEIYHHINFCHLNISNNFDSTDLLKYNSQLQSPLRQTLFYYDETSIGEITNNKQEYGFENYGLFTFSFEFKLEKSCGINLFIRYLND